MPRNQPLKWTKTVISKGKAYMYFNTGLVTAKGGRNYRALPPRSSPSFWTSYAAYCAAREKRESATSLLTVPLLVEQYQASPKFRGLSANSQEIYQIYSDRLAALFPMGVAADLLPSDMAIAVDELADTPAAANMLLAVTGALYTWARQRGLVPQGCDPVKGVERLKGGEHMPWPVALINEALASDDRRVQMLTGLLFYTGQRIGDVMDMRKAAFADGTVSVLQQKTGKPLVIPVHPKLAAIVESAGDDILVPAFNGKPLSKDRARELLQGFAATRGHKVVPHGLRKNAVIALLEVGCSIAEVAAITGQSFKMVEHYARQRDVSILGVSAMAKWAGV
jgi:integrase